MVRTWREYFRPDRSHVCLTQPSQPYQDSVDQSGSIAATAQNISTLIGASVFIGIAAAVQLSYTMIIGELVPIKDRGYWYAVTLVPVIPFAFFGAFLCKFLFVWSIRRKLITDLISAQLFEYSPRFGPKPS